MPRFNRSPNPSAAVDLTGWFVGSGTRTRLTGLSGPPRTTGVSTPLTVAAFGASLGCPPAVAASGQSWTGVGWVRSSVARTVRVGLVTWQSGSFVGGGGVGSTDVALSAGTWTQIRVTGTLGTATFNETNYHVDLPTSDAVAGTLSVSSVRIEQVTDAALVYADGDSGSGWTWDGTAGSSSSTLPDTAPVTVTDDTPAGILFGDPGGESVEALTNIITISDPLSAQIPVSDPGQASVAVEVPSGTATIQVGEPAGHAVSVVTADHPAAQVQVADPGGESVTVAEPGLPAGGAPHIALWLVDRTTGGLLPFPHALKINLSPQRNSPGAFSFDYPAAGMRFETLRSEILVQRRRVLVEMWVGGSRFNAMRGYVLQASLDDVEDEQTATAAFSGHFLEWRMSDAVVAHVPADPEGEARFVTATPGTIMRTLMLQAQARGTLTDISYTSFTNSLDSNSQAWAQVVSIKFTPYKTSYLAVLDRLVDLGLCEWDVVPGESGGPARLRLFNHGTGGRDLTTRTPPVRLRRAVSLMESQRRVDLRDSGTDLYGTGSQGRYSSAVDATARARVGAQIERDLDSGSLDTQGALTAYVAASLPLVTEPVVELTHGLVFGSSNPAPVSGFRVHDWLYSDVGRGLERVRVVQWVLSQDVSGVTGSVTLNDTIGDRISRLQRRLDALTDGSATVGTSSPPTVPDTQPPAAPTGVTADSLAYPDGAGGTLAEVFVYWTAVTTNQDTTAADDVAGYRIEWRLDLSTAAWQLGRDQAGGTSSAATFGGPAAGTAIVIRVAAYDRDGNTSLWSSQVSITTETDATAPPTPSTPTAFSRLGVLMVEWDGLGSAGEAMPVDFDYVEIHVSAASNFTPTAGTYYDRLYAAGSFPVVDQAFGVAQFFRLIAVDRTTPVPNRSGPSAQATATPSKVVADDVFAGAIGTAALQDLAVVTAKINNAAVNDLQVGNVAAGKITTGSLTAAYTLTGIIRTGTTGLRWEGDPAGIRFYNSSSVNTIRLEGGSGNSLFTGTIRSGLSGTYWAIEQDGTLRHYSSGFSGFSMIDSINGDLIMRGRLDANSRSGRINTNSIGVGINFSADSEISPPTYRSEMVVTDRLARMIAPVVIARIDGRFAAPSGIRRFTVIQTDSGGTDILASVINMYGRGLDSSATIFGGSGGQTGFVLGSTAVSVVQGSDTTAGPIVASAFNTPSSSSVKEDVQDVLVKMDPIAVLRAAPVKRFAYDWEKWRRPDPTPESPNPKPVRVEAPPRFGPMAEDLPAVLQRSIVLPDGRATIGVDLASMVGVLCSAVVVLADQADAIRAHPLLRNRT